jgi:hypothetical protein
MPRHKNAINDYALSNVPTNMPFVTIAVLRRINDTDPGMPYRTGSPPWVTAASMAPGITSRFLSDQAFLLMYPHLPEQLQSGNAPIPSYNTGSLPGTIIRKEFPSVFIS